MAMGPMAPFQWWFELSGGRSRVEGPEAVGGLDDDAGG